MSIQTAGAFSKTLKDVTTIKLGSLSKRKDVYATLKQALLDRAAAAPTERERVQILLKGFKELQRTGYATTGDSVPAVGSLKNLKHFLQQAEHDPAVGQELLENWREGLESSLDKNSVKFEFASLFGELLTQWLSTFEVAPVAAETEAEVVESDDIDMEDATNSLSQSFEEVGRKEMHEQRALFEEYVFKKRTSDEVEIEKYLKKLFQSTPLLEAVMKNCRERLGKKHTFTLDIHEVKSSIKGLISEGLLGNDKTATMKQFLHDDTVLEEVTDVINMNIAAYETWDWNADEPLLLEMRRQLNGKYRVFMDEDILEAITLHAVGEKWGEWLFSEFLNIYQTAAWKKPTPEVGKRAADIRSFYIPNPDHGAVISGFRNNTNRDFFLTLLEKTDEDEDYEGEAGAASPEMTKDSKTRLLHLLSTESRINLAIHGEFTIVRSDFQWFGPSLPHSSILSVLRFFGVRESWLQYFRRFLEAPLKFKSDGAKGEVRRRQSGVPMSHILSTVFGESIMFCMDFAINQAADGLFLYRIHDDLWFMDHRQDLCVKAWKEMQTFAKLFGLQFNKEKTGSICISKDNSKSAQPANLPTGDVIWGFLKMQPDGEFVVDQEQIDTHTAELKRQLDACKSIFSWVQAWNKYYASFLPRNFGKPCKSFGARHVNMMIETLENIQRVIFPEHGSAIAYLRATLEKDFNIDSASLPDGWFYWPILMGGLGIINPMVNLYAVRAILQKKKLDPDTRISETFREERESYEGLKRSWEKGSHSNSRRRNPPKEINENEFLSYEEFITNREVNSARWGRLYNSFLEDEFTRTPNVTPAIEKALQTISTRRTSKQMDLSVSFSAMTEYWKWIVALYAPEMEKKFGGLEVVTPGILPVGMVEAFRGLKISWEQ